MNDHTTLYALAGHAAGDFPLQPDGMAAQKLEDASVRATHVSIYTTALIPFALACDWSSRQRAVFFVALWGSHFAIDSRRWHDSAPIWFDQAFHVIALAASVLLSEVSDGEQ